VTTRSRGFSTSSTAFTPALSGGIDQVGVALCGANLGVSEDLPDRFQRCTSSGHFRQRSFDTSPVPDPDGFGN